MGVGVAVGVGVEPALIRNRYALIPPTMADDSGSSPAGIGLIEVASEPSVAKKYRICTPFCNAVGVAVAVNVVPVLPVFVALVHVPLVVSI